MPKGLRISKAQWTIAGTLLFLLGCGGDAETARQDVSSPVGGAVAFGDGMRGEATPDTRTSSTDPLVESGCNACHNPEGVPFYPPYSVDLVREILMYPPAGMPALDLELDLIEEIVEYINTNTAG